MFFSFSCRAPPSLVQVVAVEPQWLIVALTELPDPRTRLHHHLLWNCQHDPEEVGILEGLGGRKTEQISADVSASSVLSGQRSNVSSLIDLSLTRTWSTL